MIYDICNMWFRVKRVNGLGLIRLLFQSAVVNIQMDIKHVMKQKIWSITFKEFIKLPKYCVQEAIFYLWKLLCMNIIVAG